MVNDILLPKGPPIFHWVFLPQQGSLCLLPEEGCLSIAETDEKEINYLFKSYTDLE